MGGSSSVCLIYKRLSVKNLQIKKYFTTKKGKEITYLKLKITKEQSKKVNLKFLK